MLPVKCGNMRRLGSPRTRGFSLIELIVVVSIIVILLGILMPVIMMVRTGVKKSQAQTTVNEFRLGLELYRAEDPKKRYPTVRDNASAGGTDLGIHRDLIEYLDDHRMFSRGTRKLNNDKLLIDPFDRPYRYSLTRPSPAAGTEAMNAWNWDPDADPAPREARWGTIIDEATGTISDGALPFPYIWSLGPQGLTDDAREWIMAEDGQ